MFVFDLGVHRGSGQAAHSALSFLALMEVIDMLHASMRSATDPAALAAVCRKFFERFIISYGQEQTLPKHHYLLHLSQSLKSVGFILNCFTHERRHKLVKRFADALHNTGPWFNRKILMDP